MDLPEDRRQRVEAFLADYERIVRQHGLMLNACNCCDSTWVDEAEPDWDEPGRIEREMEHLRRGQYGYWAQWDED